MTTKPETANDWVIALDAELDRLGSIGDQISWAYAHEEAAGVEILSGEQATAAELDDAELRSADGRWTVRYVPGANWWTVS